MKKNIVIAHSDLFAAAIAAIFLLSACGRAGKCGAVLSAEYMLKQVYGREADIKIAEFEKTFAARGKGSVMCRELMGSCRACVTDAALILENML